MMNAQIQTDRDITPATTCPILKLSGLTKSFGAQTPSATCRWRSTATRSSV